MLGRKYTIDDLDRLIAKGKHARAIKVLRLLLAKDPKNFRLRRQMADLLILNDDIKAAIDLLRGIAEEFAEDGFEGKAIAMLKRIVRLDPSNVAAAEKILALLQQPGSPYSTVVVQPAAEEPETPPAFYKTALFTNFSRAELHDLVSAFEVRSLEPGEIVVTEGEPGDSVFLIVNGSVRVYVSNPQRRSVQVRVLEEGDFFGEISAHTGQARTATITTIGPCELLELNREALQRLGNKHPSLPLTLAELSLERIGSDEEQQARSFGPG